MVELAERSGDAPSAYRPRVLVVEREVRVRTALSRCLRSLDCSVVMATSAEDALEAVEHRAIDLAFVDPSIGVEVGRDLGSRLLDEAPGLGLILVTSCTSFGPTLSERLRSTCDHVPSAFTPGQIKRLVERFCEQRTLRQRLAEAERHARVPPGEAGEGSKRGLVAESAAMRAALESAAAAVSSGACVVFFGEPGTGRETLARYFHHQSRQAQGPFVVADLFGASEDSVACDLFGRGNALGTMHGGHPGHVEAAEGGTLFLQEIGEVSRGLIGRLLRFVRHGEFERVGETRVRHSSAQIVASSSDDPRAIAAWVSESRDTGAELLRISVPPLRDRRADIIPLARTFLEGFARAMRRGALAFTPSAEDALAAYRWPGNILELKNVIERAVILQRTSSIDVCDLPEAVSWSAENQPRLGGDFSLEQIEREHIRRVTGRAHSDVAATRILGISRSTLWRKRNV